jgi:hypothetical protein
MCRATWFDDDGSGARSGDGGSVMDAAQSMVLPGQMETVDHRHFVHCARMVA